MTPRFRPDLPLSLVGLLLVAALALPVPAMAAIVVGDGTAASCTELALRNALLVAGNEGGATIRFQCGKAPVTIALIATRFQEFPWTLFWGSGGRRFESGHPDQPY